MRTLYHGTSSVNVSCIKSIGLVPGHAKGGDAWAKDHHMGVAFLSRFREPSVFLADEEARAEDFAHHAVEEVGGDPVVVIVHVPERVFATFVVDELYEPEKDVPHAWRAHSVDVAYVAEVKPVAPAPRLSDLVRVLDMMMRGAR